MGNPVSFHSHPDDETIATGGTLAKAAAAGHRVVVVVASRGEYDEVTDGTLTPGEALAERACTRPAPPPRSSISSISSRER